MNLDDVLLTALALLAALNVAIALADWHSTSEVIKRGLGHEGNQNVDALTDLNDRAAPWGQRFWKLGAVKMLHIACILVIGYGGYPADGIWWTAGAGVVLVFLALYYAPILRENFRILNRPRS